MKTEKEVREEIQLCEAKLAEKRHDKNWYDYQSYEERIDTLWWVLDG